LGVEDDASAPVDASAPDETLEGFLISRVVGISAAFLYNAGERRCASSSLP